MPRFGGAGRRVSTSSSSSPPLPDSIVNPSSASPLEETTSANGENPPDVLMTSIYPTFQIDPSEMEYSTRRICSKVCVQIFDLSWSIVKNSTEGSSGATDEAKNKFRERFVIMFPQNMDDLPNLIEDEPPPMYSDQKAEDSRKVSTKRNIFDSVSMILSPDSRLTEVEDMDHLRVRNELGECFSVIYMTRSLRNVVQFRAA
jgi:hypothetical protein